MIKFLNNDIYEPDFMTFILILNKAIMALLAKKYGNRKLMNKSAFSVKILTRIIEYQVIPLMK
jgi:hypothetical protein